MVLGRFFLEAPQKFRWTSTRSESVLPVLPISHMGLLVNSFDFLKHHRFLKFKMGFQPALKVRCGDFGRSQLHQIMTRRATGLCGHRQWTALQHNPLRLSRLRKWGRALVGSRGISWDQGVGSILFVGTEAGRIFGGFPPKMEELQPAAVDQAFLDELGFIVPLSAGS